MNFSRRRGTGERYRVPSATSEDQEPELSDSALDLCMAQLHPPHVAEADVIGVYGRHLDPRR